jgi:imidazolonepropionase-like amidohydrolase
MAKTFLKNCNLVDGDSAPASNSTVVIANNRIDGVLKGKSTSGGPDDRVIDLQGRTVMPGMISCHYHSSYHNLGAEGFVAIGLDSPPALQAIRAAKNARTTLMGGFTSVIGAGCPFAIDASLKVAIDNGEIEGPRIVPGSRDVSTTGHTQDALFPWYFEPLSPPACVRCDGPDEFRKAIREEVKRGSEWIKIFATPGHLVQGTKYGTVDISLDELKAACEAAHQRRAKVRAHIANKEGIMMAIDAGIDAIDHGDGVDKACIDRLVDAGTFFAPSLYFLQVTYDAVQNAQFRSLYGPELKNMQAMLPVANERGVKLVVGDDFGAVGFAHGREAEEVIYYVEQCKMQPLDVIRWATKNGADMMGMADELGTITEGKLADVLVVDGDPIDDIGILKDKAKLLAIIKDGNFMKDSLSRPN